MKLMQVRDATGASQDAARDVKGLSEAARRTALSAGQAVVVAHVAAHELGAAAYAIRAVMTDLPKSDQEKARQKECQWQKSRLPEKIRNLALDDQRLRNELCWFVFDNPK